MKSDAATTENLPRSPRTRRIGGLTAATAAPAASARNRRSSPVEGRRAAAAEPIARPSISAAVTEPAATLALPNVRERIRIQTSSIARLHAPAAAATSVGFMKRSDYHKT